jgi:hypothetical protein
MVTGHASAGRSPQPDHPTEPFPGCLSWTNRSDVSFHSESSAGLASIPTFPATPQRNSRESDNRIRCNGWLIYAVAVWCVSGAWKVYSGGPLFLMTLRAGETQLLCELVADRLCVTMNSPPPGWQSCSSSDTQPVMTTCHTD